ncbi:MAG TPA: dUTP diphosphatase [Candidatus Limosilactobacillus intestinavium]|nr:dUTP diphosphatase [Candidatus Limosilactobacillus intestinavium]
MTKFELISKYADQDGLLPKRETKFSAGYDFKAAVDVTIPGINLNGDACVPLESVLVPTGVKVKLEKDQVLILANRSSNALKRNLIIPNGIGVIDSDYYNNPDNEGEIMGLFINIGKNDYHIHKGDRIMQGIITSYAVAENDQAQGKRNGGFGSTN